MGSTTKTVPLGASIFYINIFLVKFLKKILPISIYDRDLLVKWRHSSSHNEDNLFLLFLPPPFFAGGVISKFGGSKFLFHPPDPPRGVGTKKIIKNENIHVHGHLRFFLEFWQTSNYFWGTPQPRRRVGPTCWSHSAPTFFDPPPAEMGWSKKNFFLILLDLNFL